PCERRTINSTNTRELPWLVSTRKDIVSDGMAQIEKGDARYKTDLFWEGLGMPATCDGRKRPLPVRAMWAGSRQPLGGRKAHRGLQSLKTAGTPAETAPARH